MPQVRKLKQHSDRTQCQFLARQPVSEPYRATMETATLEASRASQIQCVLAWLLLADGRRDLRQGLGASRQPGRRQLGR